MLEAFKEHMEEFVTDTMLKHVLPSIVAAHMGQLAHLINDASGKPLFSPKSVQALTALSILAVNYAIHLWFFLKRRAAATKRP